MGEVGDMAKVGLRRNMWSFHFGIITVVVITRGRKVEEQER